MTYSNTFNWIVMAMVILVGGIAVYEGYINEQNLKSIKILEGEVYNLSISSNFCKGYEMSGAEVSNSSLYLNGYYRKNKYYCVWVGDRSIENIDETDRHEYCHHLVVLTPEHFCGYAYNCSNPKEWYQYNISIENLLISKLY